MPGEGDQTIRLEGVRIEAVTSGGADVFTADLAESAIKLAAVPGGGTCPCSGGQNEPVTESDRNGPSGFEQGFQMGFGGFLKTQQSFPAVFAVGVAAGKLFGLGDSNAGFVPSQVNFGNWHNHQDINQQSSSRATSARIATTQG